MYHHLATEQLCQLESVSAYLHAVASVRNSAHGKGHEEGVLAYAKAGSSLRKLPVPEHLSPNQSLPTLLFHALTYTSDFMGGCSPLVLSEKE